MSECPLCGSTLYSQVVISRLAEAKAPYPQPAYQCVGCSAQFGDTWLFTASIPNGYQYAELPRANTDPRKLRRGRRT